MPSQAHVNVTGPAGLRGTIDTAAWPIDGSRQEVLVNFDDGREIMTSPDMLLPQADGSFQLRLEGADLGRLDKALESAGVEQSQQQIVVPLVEESLKLATRTVETGRVRVSKVVREEEQVIDQPLLRETVDVQRVPVNEFVQGQPSVRYDGDTMVIPVVEEVVVIERRLMLKEEVRITRRREVVHEPQTVMLRQEDAKVERLPGAGES